MGPEIYTVEKIGTGFLSVMAKPVSGEWIEEEFQAIAAFGINQIVSLLELEEAREVGLENEAALAEENSMTFISFPIPDRALPESVSRFVNLSMRLHEEITDGINTVIHCRAGIGRTGILAAAVLLHSGYTPQQAFDLISRKRGVTVPDTDEQENWIKSNCHAFKLRT